MKWTIKHVFTADASRYEGIMPINIYLMRFVYALMVIFLGKDAWSYILTHQGEWDPMSAMAWSVWGAFSVFALIGLFHPVRMIPVLCLEVAYKLIWLTLVAYPLWRSGDIATSPAAPMISAFLWVLLPIVSIPWGYVGRTYLTWNRLGAKAAAHRRRYAS